MRYEPTFNQAGTIEWNTKFPDRKIDLTDSILLNEIYKMQTEKNNFETRTFENEIYYWISYSKLIKQLPLLNIKTTDAIQRRIKTLCEYDLLNKITVSKDNNKTFIRLTEYGLKIVEYRMTNRKGYGLETVRGTDDKPYNKYNNDKYIKDKRELSALSFFKKYNTKMYKSFMNRYGNQIRDFKGFELYFDNEVEIKNIDYETIDLEKFLFGCAKGWVKHQDKYEPTKKPEPLPAYLHKIL